MLQRETKTPQSDGGYVDAFKSRNLIPACVRRIKKKWTSRLNLYQMMSEPSLALSGSVQFTQVDIDLGFFSHLPRL